MTRRLLGTTRRVLIACAAAVLLFVAAPVRAQAPQQPTAAQQGFVPVENLPQQEHMPAAPLVGAAYAFAWVLILLYLWSIWRRLNTVEREMQAVSRRVAEERRP